MPSATQVGSAYRLAFNKLREKGIKVNYTKKAVLAAVEQDTGRKCGNDVYRFLLDYGRVHVDVTPSHRKEWKPGVAFMTAAKKVAGLPALISMTSRVSPFGSEK